MKQELVDEILRIEWEEFINTNNIGGPAECQKDKEEFLIMRGSQWKEYPEKVLKSYLEDIYIDDVQGINTIQQKYLFMMENSDPKEYEKIKHILKELSPAHKVLIKDIEKIYMKMAKEFYEKYPNISKYARPLYKNEDVPERASLETYLNGELKSYSKRTLLFLLDYLKEIEKDGVNIVYNINNRVFKEKGFVDIETLERNIYGI